MVSVWNFMGQIPFQGDFTGDCSVDQFSHQSFVCLAELAGLQLLIEGNVGIGSLFKHFLEDLESYSTRPFFFLIGQSNHLPAVHGLLHLKNLQWPSWAC